MSLTLLDTCVWVYFLAGRSPRLNTEVSRLIQADEVIGHPFVFGELLMGAGGRARNDLLARYPDLVMAPTINHNSVVTYVRKHRLANRGIGWIDVHLLASASEAGARLWTEEAALRAAAAGLGLAR